MHEQTLRAVAARATLALALSGCGASTECADYIPTSIAAMRGGGGVGCFELSHVVVVARTPSTSAPRLYVQDPAGGDFSAIRAKCDARSAHACPASTAAAVQSVVDGAAVTLRGYFHQGSASGFEELYLDELVDEGTLLASSPPRTVSIGDLGRSADARAAWFQIVTSVVPSEAPLVMYDFSPLEFTSSEPCPRLGGFAVISAQLAAGPNAVRDCSSMGTSPPGRRKPDSREILVGREFFKEFFASTDCACAAASKQHLLDASSTLVGPITGIVVPELGAGAPGRYQVFHPLSRAQFPISGG